MLSELAEEGLIGLRPFANLISTLCWLTRRSLAASAGLLPARYESEKRVCGSTDSGPRYEPIQHNRESGAPARLGLALGWVTVALRAKRLATIATGLSAGPNLTISQTLGVTHVPSCRTEATGAGRKIAEISKLSLQCHAPTLSGAGAIPATLPFTSPRLVGGVAHKAVQASGTMHQREQNGMKAPNCAPNWPICSNAENGKSVAGSIGWGTRIRT